MPIRVAPFVQFIADHKWMLWIVVAVGVSNVVTSTILHAPLRDLARRAFESRMVEDAMQQRPACKPLVRLGMMFLDWTWMRFVGITFGIVLIATGLIGLLAL
jgi:hypothetical protein